MTEKLSFEEQPGTWVARVRYSFSQRREFLVDPRYITSCSTGRVHLADLKRDRDFWWNDQCGHGLTFLRTMNEEEINQVRELLHQ